MTTFALHPEIEFEHRLAYELHMTVARMHEEMDMVEFLRWVDFFAKKTREEKEAIDRAKRRG